VLRPIADMPPGTLGFEAVGSLDDDDWEATAEPVLRREIAAGRKLRLLYHLGLRSDDVEGDAIAAGAEFRARHATAFDRVAVVSDEDWLRPALRVLSVLVPGRTRAFPTRELAAAKAWLAEGS
jgi:SpoIIAA-like